MFKKLRFLPPLVVLALSLFSCGAKVPNRIKRVEYAKITDNIPTRTHEILNDIFLNQTEPYGDGARRLILPKKGNINTTFEIALDGLITYEELRLKDFNLTAKTNYQFIWNMDKHFAEYRGDNNSWYIVKDVDKYYCAYSYTVDKRVTKERVLTSLYDDEDFTNYLRRILKERGLVNTYIDLGLSGLGYNAMDYIADENKCISIASLFHDASGIMYGFYDYLNEKAGEGHNIAYTVASDKAGTFSSNLMANFDLAMLSKNVGKDIPEIYKEIIEYIFGYAEISGDLNFDLFAAWGNNYICQQEYIVDCNNLHYNGDLSGVYADINVNGNIYFGEEVSRESNVTDAKIEQIIRDYEPKE